MLFDLESDPGEKRDVARENPETVAELKQAIADWEKQVPPPRGVVPLR